MAIEDIQYASMSRRAKIMTTGSSLGISAAIIVAAITMTTTAPVDKSTSSDHDAVQRFFDYHGADAVTNKNNKPTEKAGCVPCAAKTAALKAGGVPSQPPALKVDRPFQRITGRSPAYLAPAVHGMAIVRMPEKLDAWVSISQGMPFQQLRCHLVVTDSGLFMSSISGTTTADKTITIPWQAAAPAQLGTWGPLIKMGAQDIWQTMRSLPQSITTGQVYGRYQAYAVSPEQLLFVASMPSKLQCDDLELQISKQGLPVRITHIQATDTSDTLHASRQIWLLTNP